MATGWEVCDLVDGGRQLGWPDPVLPDNNYGCKLILLAGRLVTQGIGSPETCLSEPKTGPFTRIMMT